MDELLKPSGKALSSGELWDSAVDVDFANLERAAKEIAKFDVGEYCRIEGTQKRRIKSIFDYIPIELGIELRVRGDGENGMVIYYPKGVIVWHLLCKNTKGAKKFKCESGETNGVLHFKIWRAR